MSNFAGMIGGGLMEAVVSTRRGEETWRDTLGEVTLREAALRNVRKREA